MQISAPVVGSRGTPKMKRASAELAHTKVCAGEAAQAVLEGDFFLMSRLKP
jgi:hypothetical protein